MQPYWSPQSQVPAQHGQPPHSQQWGEPPPGGVARNLNPAFGAPTEWGKLNSNAPVFTLGGGGGGGSSSGGFAATPTYEPGVGLMNSGAAEFVPGAGIGAGGVPPHHPQPPQPPPQVAEPSLVQVNRGGAVYFVSELETTAGGASDPLAVDWTEGTPQSYPGQSGSAPAPIRKTLGSMALPTPLRMHLQAQTIDMLRQVEPDDERYKEIPPRFTTIWPLDSPTKARHASGSFGYPSAVFKVASRDDGVTYALRRLDHVRATPKIAQAAQDRWQHMRHPNMIGLERVFVHHKALFFLHAYWPTAQTVADRYITARTALSEQTIWSFLVQLSSAVRLVHASNLACRCIEPTHVLVTSGSRVRLSGIGVADVVEFEQVKSLAEQQRDDIVALGRTVLSVAARSPVTNQNLQQCLMIVAQQFSPELHNVLANLITKPPSIFELSAALATHAFDELDMMYGVADALESHLSNEAENGRLLKLMLKLGLINERPEHQMNERWADSGDRYVIKLFRDFLFHQVDEEGNAVVDMGHVVNSLNKLDTGDPEQVVLSSPDQQSLLVASFHDVRRMVDDAFAELNGAKDQDAELAAHLTASMSGMGLHHQAQQPMMDGGQGFGYPPHHHRGGYGGRGGRGGPRTYGRGPRGRGRGR